MQRIRRVGLTTIALTISLVVGMAGSAPLLTSAAGTAWTTDHFDATRSGHDLNDPELAATPALSWTSPTVDGVIYGEPLCLNGIVYVATQRNSLYAFNATDGHLLWTLPTIMLSVPLAEVHMETGTNCGNIDPMGIIGTPVIDASLGPAGTLFAAADTYQPGVANTIEHRLLAIDLNTHAVTSRNIDPPIFASGVTRGLEQERGALNIANGYVVVPYGGMAGDCGAYHGFVVSSLENLTGPANPFEVDPGTGNTRGGIWAASGAAVDGAGNVYVSTGNGAGPTNPYDLSDGVIKLPPIMGQPLISDTAHYFAPDVWQTDNSADLDLGSMTPTIIPRAGSNLIFQTGKQNIGFLLNSTNLGGVAGQLFPPVASESTAGHVCDGQARGGTVYAAPHVYVPCTEGIRALTVNSAAPSFARAWIGPSDASGPPIMAGGRVWVHGTNRLLGLNAATGAIEAQLAVSTPYNFGSASAGGGRLFYPAGTSVVAFRPAASNYIAAIGGDNSAWYKRDPGAWTPIAGISTGAPAVASLPNGSTGNAVFIAVGTDRDLYVRDEANIWKRLNFNGTVTCIDNPAAVIASSTLYVACMGADNTLWAGSAAVSGTLLPRVDRASWQNLGGVLIAGPAVASVNGTITYFAEGTDHHVYTRTPPSAGFSPTQWFCNGHPAATTFGTTSHFACHGLDRQLWYNQQWVGMGRGSTAGGDPGRRTWQSQPALLAPRCMSKALTGPSGTGRPALAGPMTAAQSAMESERATSPNISATSMKQLDRLAQNWRIDKAKSFVAKGDRVLDIGCADGALFQRLGDRVGEGIGLDPDMGQREPGPNFRLLNGMFPADLPDDRPFDVITLLAVLEHIPRDQQSGLATACAQFLTPGGRVVVTVPSGAVDPIANALASIGVADGMSLDQHYGFKTSEVVPLFTSAGLGLVARQRFQLGLNNLFVFRKFLAAGSNQVSLEIPHALS